MKKIIPITVLLAIFLNSCALPFSKFYYDQTGGIDITNNPRFEITVGKPKLYRGNNQEEDYQTMLENGYALVGYSSFNAGNVNENGAYYQAKKVHASLVLLYSKYTNTVSGLLPLTFPDNKTSNTNIYGTVTGSKGSATYSGTATTTTRGTKTTYIPYNIHRSDYLATYWVKFKKPVLGIHVLTLTNELRRQIGSNKGMLINAVVIGSPAFRADIFKSDIIKKIGNIDIFDLDSFQESIAKYHGQSVNILLLRDNNEITKTIKLNSKNN